MKNEELKDFFSKAKTVNKDNLDWFLGKNRNYKINRTKKWQHTFKLPLVDYFINSTIINLLNNYGKDEDNFVTILPKKEGDNENVLFARQMNKVLNYCLRKNDFLLKIKKVFLDMLIFGIGIIRIGMKFQNEKLRYYDIVDDDVKEVEEEIEDIYPSLKVIDPEKFFFVEHDGDIIECAEKYENVDYKRVVNILLDLNDERATDKIKTLKEKETYTIIILQDKSRQRVYINDDLVFEKLTFLKSNRLPYFCFVFYPFYREILLISLIDIIKDSVEYMEELVNLSADNGLLNTLQVYLFKSASSAGKIIEGDLEPGKILKVSSSDDFKPLFVGNYTNNFVNEINLHTGFLNNLIGTIIPSVGSGVNLGNTATEARLNVLLSKEKSLNLVENINRKTLIPLLESLIEMIQQFADIMDIEKISGEDYNKLIENKNMDLKTDLLININLKEKDLLKQIEIEKLNQLSVFLNAISSVPEGLRNILINKVLTLYDIDVGIPTQATSQIADQKDSLLGLLEKASADIEKAKEEPEKEAEEMKKEGENV